MTFNPTNLRNFSKTYKNELTRRMDNVITEAKDTIVKRTRAGESPDGGGWPGYSPPYAKIRERAGRQTGYVDHTFTGKMLQSLQTETKVEGTQIVGRIFFNNAESQIKAEGTNKLRPWFDFGDRLIKQIKQRFSKL